MASALSSSEFVDTSLVSSKLSNQTFDLKVNLGFDIDRHHNMSYDRQNSMRPSSGTVLAVDEQVEVHNL